MVIHHAHHIKPWMDHPELRYDYSNVISLCHRCHLWVHSLKNTDGEYLDYEKFANREPKQNPPNVDDINQLREERRLAAIKLAEEAQERRKIGLYSSNKSGYVGVCYYRKGDKWQATIWRNGRNVWSGYFPTPEAANEARQKALRELI